MNYIKGSRVTVALKEADHETKKWVGLDGEAVISGVYICGLINGMSMKSHITQQ